MWRQQHYDAAIQTSGDRLIDFVEAVGKITNASLAISSAVNAQILRDYACPEANPLNEAVSA